MTLDHVYTTAGHYIVYATATDKDGGVSSVADQPLDISAISLAPAATTQLMRPTIEWAAINDAVTYDVWISKVRMAERPRCRFVRCLDRQFVDRRVSVRTKDRCLIDVIRASNGSASREIPHLGASPRCGQFRDDVVRSADIQCPDRTRSCGTGAFNVRRETAVHMGSGPRSNSIRFMGGQCLRWHLTGHP